MPFRCLEDANFFPGRNPNSREFPSLQSFPASLGNPTATFVEQVYLGLTTSYLVRLSDHRQLMARRISDGSAIRFAPGNALHVVWAFADGLLHVD